MVIFLLQNVYRITGIGSIPVGRVEEGTLLIGMSTRVQGGTFTIIRIEKEHKQQQSANQGDAVGLSVSFKAQANEPEKGFLAKLFSGSDQGYSVLKKYVGKRIEFS